MNPLLKVLPTDRLPHTFQIIATIFAGASIFTLCWYLSMKGLLDLAATGLCFFILQFLRSSGVPLARRAPAEFTQTATMLDTARAEFAEWMSNRKLLSRIILAFLATVIFLVGRMISAMVLTWIASPWLALALGLAVTAVVVSPVLFKALADSFRSSNGTNTSNATAGGASQPSRSGEVT